MLRSSLKIARGASHALRRSMATVTTQPPGKKEGDISDSFVSLSGNDRPILPDRFRLLKRDLVKGREGELTASWTRLLRELKKENEIVITKGPGVVPQVEYQDLEKGVQSLKGEMRKRGVVVVKGVVPENEARAYKEEIEEYVRKNPSTKGQLSFHRTSRSLVLTSLAFPQNNPQVYELYWSAAQLKARGHPSLLRVQHQLMSALWRSSSASTPISLTNPLTYADRLRIRQPGDSAFALGPHIDGGSVERWEKEGYGLGGVYDAIFAGRWEEYDPWDASGRVDAVNNRYDGLGACSMFRAWQGWLSMSRTRPRGGTLLVNPLMHLSTAYVLLRPFFKAIQGAGTPGYLNEKNWVFVGADEMTSELQGATPGHGQELNDELHPHLELNKTMVHVPEIEPGDFVAWHCDTIHSVDKVHTGTSDSSVLYIPVCPLTDFNAKYVVRQRQAFRDGTPGPDFPGGQGEAQHVDRPSEDMLRKWTNGVGRAAFGLEKLVAGEGAGEGERAVVESAK
ncbi:hypothetical protein G7046_g6894 [Stylonectria norvegica]|nr:hypothetical protein G7046_g6894 [Stylonectria norvegica]